MSGERGKRPAWKIGPQDAPFLPLGSGRVFRIAIKVPGIGAGVRNMGGHMHCLAALQRPTLWGST